MANHKGRVRHRPLLERVLLAGEGQSERSYAAWLGRLVQIHGLPFHIDARMCGHGGGDLLRVVEEVIAHMRREKALARQYVLVGVFVDGDTLGANKQRDDRARQLVDQYQIDLVVQDPDHEAFLLRHLPAYRAKRPPPGHAIKDLRREWGNYEKGLPADYLAERLNPDWVREVCKVEHELRRLLGKMGWPL